MVLAANEKNTLEVKCVDQAGNPLKGIRVEAIELIKVGGGFSIENGRDFSMGVKNLLEDNNLFLNASYAATDVIHRNLGSSTRIVRGIIHD